MKIREAVYNDLKDGLKKELVKILAKQIAGEKEFQKLKAEVLSEMFEESEPKKAARPEFKSNANFFGQVNPERSEFLGRVQNGEFKDRFEKLIGVPAPGPFPNFISEKKLNNVNKFKTPLTKESERMTDQAEKLFTEETSKRPSCISMTFGEPMSEEDVKKAKTFQEMSHLSTFKPKFESTSTNYSENLERMRKTLLKNADAKFIEKLEEYPEGTKDKIIEYIKKNKSKITYRIIDGSSNEERHFIYDVESLPKHEGLAFQLTINIVHNKKTKENKIKISNVVFENEGIKFGTFKNAESLEIYNCVMENVNPIAATEEKSEPKKALKKKKATEINTDFTNVKHEMMKKGSRKPAKKILLQESK